MKKLMEVVEVENEGLIALLGQNVLLFCLNYIYTGKLVGVNDTCVMLENPSIVYETGAFSAPGYKDAQPLHVSTWYVSRGAIESFGTAK
jgi:hypothetical protein